HRLGSVRDRTVDVRLISATHQDLKAAAAAGRFRRDLYYRLATLPLVVPALRERREDIVALAHWLLRSVCHTVGRRQGDLSPDACRALEGYAWPGNVRELRNVLERAVLLCDRDRLEAKDLGLDRASEQSVPETSLTLAQLERQHIERVLHE